MDITSILKKGKSYTIAMFTDKGWPDSRSFVCTHVIEKPVLDDPKQKKYLILQAGGGFEKWIVIHPSTQYVIWNGVHKVNTAILVSRKQLQDTAGPIMSEQRWPVFDGRYLNRAKKGIKTSPIAEYIAPLQPERLIIYQCIS